MKQLLLSILILLSFSLLPFAQRPAGKPISPDLFGIFFEDISYAADGGLYAELLQNRSFEYSPADRKGWHSLTGWEYTTAGFGYGGISVETASPLNVNNPHYVRLVIEDEGRQGIGLVNLGFDGIPARAGEKYKLSFFARLVSDQPVPVEVSLHGPKEQSLHKTTFSVTSREWTKYEGIVTAGSHFDTALLYLLAKGKGRIDLDCISLFPEHTFHDRPNGLRADLAQSIAALKPAFMRFPGGCLVHGDGLGNMYRWKNTIGPIEQRVEQRNIWNYHQTTGLGYFEFFQFCEDIGAKPLPVVAAGVSCQNSGGTWSIGSTGQKGLPMDAMQDYIQEIFDLIEWANGPATSTWGAKRAAAGHPEPFHLEYIGIGNEDKQTDAFRDRFQMIYAAVKAKHPEVTIVGTVGPDPAGSDYDQGWKLANQLAVPVVDEHYYQKPEWFVGNGRRYDTYDRSRSKVYVGEYASWGNTLFNALAEGLYMTSLERNGDVVRMSSYAPLLARTNHTSWNPDLIYFDNTSVTPSVNYYVQQLFSANKGDIYYPNIVSLTGTAADSTRGASVVKDSRTGDYIIKLVNVSTQDARAKVDWKRLGLSRSEATQWLLTGAPDRKNLPGKPDPLRPTIREVEIHSGDDYTLPAYSLTVIRTHQKGRRSNIDSIGAYLMVYFKDTTHGLYMALSKDGYSFTDVNNAEPIMAGDTIAFQKGIRDPHIMRGPGNAFYLAMTDLHIYAKRHGYRDTEWERDGKAYGWGNNRALVLMKSTDLIHWTRTNLRVDKAFPEMDSIGCAWAPETIYDSARKKLMLYFTTRFNSGINKMYYTYMDDAFTKMETHPQQLFVYPKEKNTIDGDITKVNGKYHLFYVPHDGVGGVKQAVSDKINTGWVYDSAYVDPEPTGCEAPTIYQRIGEQKWVLIYDIYGIHPHNFGFSETSDFVHFKDLGHFNEGVMKATNFFSPKHGAVIQLTRREAQELADHWGLQQEF